MNITSHNNDVSTVKPKEFQLLITDYANEIWDGEIYLDGNGKFRKENQLLWDLLYTNYNYIHSGISVNSIKSSGFSDEGVYIIYQAFRSLLLPGQRVLSLIKDEIPSMV
jgi:hypothetical protein